MSDEQKPPPPLRLKPRLRPPEGEAPASAQPTSAPPAPAGVAPLVPPPPPAAPPAPAPAAEGAAQPKIRFKPRLVAPAAPGGEAAPLPPAPAPAPEIAPAADAPAAPVRLKPRLATDAPPPPVAAAPAPATLPPEPPPAMPPPPAVIPPPETIPPAPPAAAEGLRFKLKPKAPGGTTPPIPPPPAVVPAGAPPPPLPPPPGVKLPPPPFPVVAGPKSPPVPHINLNAQLPEAQKPPPPVALPPKRPRRSRTLRLALLGAGLLVVLGGGAYLGLPYLLEEPPPPPKPKAPTASAPSPKAQPAAPAPAAPAPVAGSSLAHAPANAIDRAQKALAAREAAGHSDVGAADPSLRRKDPSSEPPPGPALTKSAAMTSVAPGVSATTEIQSVATANPAFQSFVANAKVSGVFENRAIINNRLIRAGEVVDAGLGIVFEGADPERRQLIFKDRTGATVARRY